MRRTVQALALVLKKHPVGENHRGLSLLVSGEGLIRPLAFGAQSRRSSLRATAVPFNLGMADLKFDSVKNQWRLENFDPKNCHDALGENLDRYYTASAWAEVLLATHGSGDDSDILLTLISEGLNLLCQSEGDAIVRLKTGLLWHFLDLEGVQPDPDQCGQCGREIPDGVDNVPWWKDGMLLCPGCCITLSGNSPLLSRHARSWFSIISTDLVLAVSKKLAIPDMDMATDWVAGLIGGLVERPLKMCNN